jgi:hypothetical protein
MRHYQRKTDTNHKEITAFLRRLNCAVIDLSAVGGGVPDLGSSQKKEKIVR